MTAQTNKTPLYDAHVALSGKIIEFASYMLPVQYSMGMIEEHKWVREQCGIFDVSHMGQVLIEGDGICEIFSKITPTNFVSAKQLNCKYTVLLNKDGGIIDDMIFTKLSENKMYGVINASRKFVDMDYISKHLPPNSKLSYLDDRCLIAVQGPKSVDVVKKIFFGVSENQLNFEDFPYMSLKQVMHPKYKDVYLTKTGYTGEDGFEISVSSSVVCDLWSELLNNPFVKPIGLGARDTLRLEAGYPLYGNDINESTTPIEAGISFVVSKNHSNFYGFEKILNQKLNGPQVKRVSLKLAESGVLRPHYQVFLDSECVGESTELTSGGYIPTLEFSIGQCYLKADQIEYGKTVFVKIRSKIVPAIISKISFLQS